MAKKLILLVLCIALTGCAKPAKQSISQIAWPMPVEWVELFGDSPESQQNWNIRLLGRYMKEVDKKFQELENGTDTGRDAKRGEAMEDRASNKDADRLRVAEKGQAPNESGQGGTIEGNRGK